MIFILKEEQKILSFDFFHRKCCLEKSFKIRTDFVSFCHETGLQYQAEPTRGVCRAGEQLDSLGRKLNKKRITFSI